MKLSIVVKKIIVGFMSLSLVLLAGLYSNVIYALDNHNMELYGIEETYTIQGDRTLDKNYGYVKCKVGITYNSVGNTYRVAWVECEPHLSSSYPLLKFGSASVEPGVGKLVTLNYVTVSFIVGNGAVADAKKYSVNLYL